MVETNQRRRDYAPASVSFLLEHPAKIEDTTLVQKIFQLSLQKLLTLRWQNFCPSPL